MASPNEASIQDQIYKWVHPFETIREASADNVENWIDQEEVWQGVVQTDEAARLAAIMDGGRARLAALQDDVRAGLEQYLITYGRVLGFPELGAINTIQRIYDNFVANAKDINSREFTFGGPLADGGNVGDGRIVRLTLDAAAFDIENQHADSKVAHCIQDRNGGAAKHEEVFELFGEGAEKDRILIAGSGRRSLISALSARTSFLQNSSFSNFSPLGTPAAVTNIPGWTSASGNFNNIDMDETNFYRDFEGDTTPRAIIFQADEKISQAISVTGNPIRSNTPYYPQIAYNRLSTGADGTLTLRWGSQSVAVALGAAPATGWNLLTLPADENLWKAGFNEDPLDFEIEVSGGATFGLRVDDAGLWPGTQFDGSWYWFIGGATPFLADHAVLPTGDRFTWSDTAIDATVIQYRLWRDFDRYWPHDKLGTESWTPS